MTKKPEDLEKVLGKTIARKDALPIPGVNDPEGMATIYFSCPAGLSSRALFKRITNHTNPPNAQSGGAVEAGCEIEAPWGKTYHGIQFHGDLAGWKEDIRLGALAEGVDLATIEGASLRGSVSEVAELEDCEITFR